MNPTSDAGDALQTWSALSPTSAHGQACFPASLAVFAGHFPGHPLVPGVHQLALIAALVQRVYGHPLRAVQVARCKWTRPVLPDETITVTAHWTITEHGHVLVKGTTAVGEHPACNVSLTLVP